MKRISSSVEMIPFSEVRIITEMNHNALSSGKAIHKKLTLSPNEEAKLEELSHCCNITHAATVLYQKLLIKKSIYTNVTAGNFMSEEIDFVKPLEEEVRSWVWEHGYALSPKSNTIWITQPNGWQYEATDSPPPSKTQFTILW